MFSVGDEIRVNCSSFRSVKYGTTETLQLEISQQIQT